MCRRVVLLDLAVRLELAIRLSRIALLCLQLRAHLLVDLPVRLLTVLPAVPARAACSASSHLFTLPIALLTAAAASCRSILAFLHHVTTLLVLRRTLKGLLACALGGKKDQCPACAHLP